MGTINKVDPAEWRPISTDAIETDVGLAREPVVDTRGQTPSIRIMDGVTPGGHPVTNGVLNIVDRPNIVAPLDGAANITPTPILTGSPFSGTSGETAHTHLNSRWQISLNSDFSTILHDSGITSTHLTSYDTASANLELDLDTTYFVRVRYFASTGTASEWSPPSTFTTRLNNIPAMMTGALTAGDGAAGDRFGWDVSLSANGTTALVGARVRDTAGGAYVYDLINGVWTQTAFLTTPVLASGDYFGHSVQLAPDGMTAFVGAPFDVAPTTLTGSVIVFRKINDTWIEGETLIPDDAPNQENARFGTSLTLSGNGITLIVGTEQLYDNGVKGGFYEFTLTNGQFEQTARIVAPDLVGLDGHSVSISDDGLTLAVGAPETFVTENGSDYTAAGKVNVYVKPNENWSLAVTLNSVPLAAGENFGKAVSLSGDGERLAVGAPFAQSDGYGRGAVYLFDNIGGTWTFNQRLESPATAIDAQTGYDVKLNANGTVVFIGAPEAGAGGEIYIFELGTSSFVHHSTLTATDATALGFSLHLASATGSLLSGAPLSVVEGNDTGNAFFFNAL